MRIDPSLSWRGASFTHCAQKPATTFPEFQSRPHSPSQLPGDGIAVAPARAQDLCLGSGKLQAGEVEEQSA
jgi:hypothetical protein